MELAQDHMAKGKCQRGIGTLLGMQPDIGQLGDFGIIRRNGHRLGAVVARLGEEVGIGCSRLRYVGTPGDDVAAVIPIGRFRYVGLLAPYLRRGGWQIAVPIIKTQAGAAQQREVTCTGGVTDH